MVPLQNYIFMYLLTVMLQLQKGLLAMYIAIKVTERKNINTDTLKVTTQ